MTRRIRKALKSKLSGVTVIYYRLEGIAPEQVREMLPSALEFKNPTPESFKILLGKLEGKNIIPLEVFDVRSEERIIYVYEAPENEYLAIKGVKPRVFGMIKSAFEDFLQLLAEDKLDEIPYYGLDIRKKGRKRLGKELAVYVLSGFMMMVVGGVTESYLHNRWIGYLFGAVILVALGYFLMPRKVRKPINEVSYKYWEKAVEKAVKKGKMRIKWVEL
ncbi:Hypothetical protein TES1_0464 [Thermococcus paralvinellae]|uniref:Uncharacterized protein n=2 Tax=Thermococcus paralvinellae TaxID=582419 RepID=W0I628_9EURY|nr:Hypothetical protein TES1_0464 [Thermococcus paralvinellae]